MRGINGEKLGLKHLNVGKILIISGLRRVKCLRSNSDYSKIIKKSHEEIHLNISSAK